MRLFAFVHSLILLGSLSSPVLAQDALGPTEPSSSAPDVLSVEKSATYETDDQVILNTLFDELRHQRDENEAQITIDRITAIWRDSGSATGNLLMQWAGKAMADKKRALALDFLDQVTVLWPDYVEGWNRRATLHYVMGNYARSMTDIRRVLSLEPRHFGALAGMAAIFERTDEDELALRTWEKVLEIYPANRNAQSRVSELADKLTGQRT